MLPIVTVFRRSPDGGKGLARDMRVRWALEEVGQAYEVRLVSFEDLKGAEHRARHPFGQIPTFERDGLVLFESGAIVLHLALTYPGLLPGEPEARARAMMWMFAAVSTVEPPIVEREQSEYTDRGQPWYSRDRLALLDDRIRARLVDLSAHLGDREWLDGGFSAGDLLMVLVLRRVDAALLAEFPGLAGYVARAEARPAYRRAFAAQWAINGGGGAQG